MTTFEKVTRLVIVDHTGRVFDKSNVRVRYSFQDDDRTLKVFVDDPRKPAFDWEADDTEG